MEAVCIQALSVGDDFQIVERRDLEALLGEQALRQALTSPKSASQAGQLLGAEVLLSVRKEQAELLLEAVEPQSGRIIGSARTHPAELAIHARKLLAGRSTAQPRSSVAVMDFAGDGFRRAAELRESLKAMGFNVLDRAIIEHAVAECALTQAGMVKGGTVPSLLGADYVVEGNVLEEKLNLQVMDMARGSLLAVHVFAREATPAQMIEWMDGLLPRPAQRRLSLAPIVQVETLIPLYEGIACFRDGDMRGALRAFWRAQELDDKFVEALEWEARCYDALALPRLGEAVRRYSRECLVGRGISVPTKNITEDGITFLGIQGEALPSLEMKAVNALLATAPGRVVLPEQLSAYRDEYDALIGGTTDTSRWTRAPGFLTRWSLRGTPVSAGIRWTLFDTLSGRIVASAESEGFPFGKMLADMAEGHATDRMERPVIRDLSATKSQDNQNLTRDQADNLTLLQLLVENPASPGLWGRNFKRGDSDRDGFAGFLNFALCEHLIAVLPADNVHRAWLELIQIGKFLPWEQNGRLFSGENRDPLKALNAFIKKHPADAPGAFARYILLWEVMDSVPRSDLVGLCKETEAALQAQPDTGIGASLDELRVMTQHLKTIAEIAANGPLTPLPPEPSPRRARPRLLSGNRVLPDYTTFWLCNEWNRIPSPPELWQQEAVAAIHILGRRNNLIRIPPSWMKDSPDSIVLLDFSVESLHEVDHPYGAPFLNPFDMDAERRNYVKIVDYCERGLPRWLERADDARAFDFITGYTARRFVTYLTRYGFMDEVSDERFLRIQQNTAGEIRKASMRIGTSPDQRLGYWSRMPRRQSNEVWSVGESSVGEPCDYDALMAEESAVASISWRESPVEQRAWWDFMRRWDMGALRPQKQAEIAFRHYGDMQRIFPAKDVALLGYRETAFVFDFAYTLFAGRRYAEAEPWFRLVSEAPESVLLKTSGAREIKESARLYLAYCLVSMGRSGEALPLAKRCVSLSGGGMPLRLLEHIRPNQAGVDPSNRGSLYGAALRLVRDLRLAADMIELPANIRGFQIPVAGGNGAQITFFLRIPSGASTAAAASCHVLALAPSLNHGAEEYMQDGNEWAKFADEKGLFLLVPEFNWTAAEVCNAYQVTADWSGETLLTAVEWVGKNYPGAGTRRFLLHGYGAGGQFVQRFARWAPERCLGVSSHSAGAPSWLDGMPGEKLFSSLRDVPMLLTCGTDDDMSVCLYDRRAFSEQYVTAARGAGVPIIWKPLKNVGHGPTAEMENLSRLFLAACTQPSATESPALVGDLRNGHYWQAKDPLLNEVPVQFRQKLPNAEFARAWSGGY